MCWRGSSLHQLKVIYQRAETITMSPQEVLIPRISLVFGLWSLVFGLWFLVFGLWPLAFGPWSLVFELGRRQEPQHQVVRPLAGAKAALNKSTRSSAGLIASRGISEPVLEDFDRLIGRDNRVTSAAPMQENGLAAVGMPRSEGDGHPERRLFEDRVEPCPMEAATNEGSRSQAIEIPEHAGPVHQDNVGTGGLD